MTPTPSAVPGQVTTGTNMEQGGDWSPDIQHSSPPGFPSPGRSSPTLQTPREQRPARGPRQPPGGTTAVPEYPVSAPSRRDEPMRRPPTSDEDRHRRGTTGPFVPELSTSTPPRRDEPLMELTSDEEDQDGEQQPEPLVLPVTKDDYHRSHVDGRSYADVTREGRGREPTQVFYQRRTRGRGYSNWDREQVRSRQRRDRYEPRKEETRRRFYDGANRYDRAAKQNGGNDRYRHGGQQPNNVVNRNRNSSHFGRRLKRETLREVRAQLVQRLAGAPSSRPADGGDDAIQPATQSDPERTTAQHSQQTLDVPVRTPASVSIPAMAQSRLIVTAEIHPPPRGQRSPEILMTPTPSAVPGQVTTGTNMEQGGDWSPDIQHSSPPGFPSPGRSSPTLQTPREQRPARGPRQPPGGTTAVPEYPVSAPSRRDEPMRRPPTSDEDTDGEQQSGPFVPELSTSTPPRRDEPLMELTSDEEDQDGEQQPEPLVLPVTKDDYHRSHVDGRSYADVTREGRGREPTQVFYQRRTRGRGYSNWDREQVRSRQRRDRYEPRKEETRRRFYDGANRYDRAAKQNGGNDRYRHGGQQPNNVVNRNRNRTLTLPLRGPAATLVADSRGRLCVRYGLNWYKGWLVHHLQGLRMEEMMPFNLPHK
ncbi:hypothetical protein DPEC_G00259610 [Dallia pectoralis]|uniref:Uncharacterized protein n=1 Tax=Dallia pectoralis TaxID=75939 RepID=A0ACC2FRL0_DALPE|nr:hypothetical protein DPEC_G00259610 [Dallia pectoralis]